MSLRASDFDYDLPARLIAQAPAEPRDSSRLMVLDRATVRRSHRTFAELPQLLGEGDLLVVNDTRVVPARFDCRRGTGGRIEALFLRELPADRWEVMLKGAARCRAGEVLALDGEADHGLKIVERLGEGVWVVEPQPPAPAAELLDRIGRTPLPPYIHRLGLMADPADRRAYQTIYAERPGAVAAPTAGLHFTDSVIEGLRRRGVEMAHVTLHVGLGTFQPVKTERLADHAMHAEWYELPADAAKAVSRAKAAGRRVVAVGTTSVRVLETAAGGDQVGAAKGWTDLFICPPAEFRCVDAMLTNFHLPRSTLLMLVAAFCRPGSTDGLPVVLDAYAEAVGMEYRFYSYGDAMLIV